MGNAVSRQTALNPAATPASRQPAESASDAAGIGDLPGLFESVFSSIPSGVVVFDRKLRVVLRNHAARVLLPEAEDVSQALSAVALNDGCENWATELRNVMDARRSLRIDAVVRRVKDHPDAYLNVVCNPLRDPGSGDVTGGVMLIEDVTPRISMEQRLAVTERMAAVGKLASRVAHELNNPLDGVQRYLSLAARVAGEGRDDKVLEYLEQARTGVTRMTQIISSLLEFSRSAHNTLEQATINKIVEDALSAMAGRAQDSGVTVVCNFTRTDMPVVRGSNIFQVFCNVIKNAVDAMPEGGTLTVTTGIVGPDVVVTFEDTGVGLPPEADRIFEPFFTTKPPGKGTGLGLAVCKEMIERYSGAITAERREPRGTRVVVRIPTRNCGAVPVGPRESDKMLADSPPPAAGS